MMPPTSKPIRANKKLLCILSSAISIAISVVFIVAGNAMLQDEPPRWIMVCGYLTILYGSVNIVLNIAVWLRTKSYLNKISTYSAIAFMVLTIAASLDSSMISGMEWGGIILVALLLSVNWYTLRNVVNGRACTDDL
jgi:hypothetical protein